MVFGLIGWMVLGHEMDGRFEMMVVDEFKYGFGAAVYMIGEDEMADE